MPAESKIRLTKTQGRGTIEVYPSDIIGRRYAGGRDGAVLTLRPGTLIEGGNVLEQVTVEEPPAEADRLMRQARGS